MNYKCQQCGCRAEIRGTQMIDQYDSPYIDEYVVCGACGYTIARDTLDRQLLLKVCESYRENCRMALSGEWDKGDDGFQASFDSVNSVIALVTSD